MGLYIVVEIEEFPDLLLKDCLVLFAILVMADTLLSQGSVEAFDMRLLILFVCPGGPMTLAMEQNLIVAFRLELRSAVALPDNESTHRLRRSCDTLLADSGFQRFADLNIRFAGERVDCGVGK